MKVIGSKSGFALLVSFIFLTVLTVIVITFVSMVSTDMRYASVEKIRAKSFYIAEAGLNKAVWYLANTAPDGSVDGSWRTSGYPTDPGPHPLDPQLESFDGGEYVIWVESAGANIQITSRGKFHDSKTVVRQQISFPGPVSVNNSWQEI